MSSSKPGLMTLVAMAVAVAAAPCMAAEPESRSDTSRASIISPGEKAQTSLFGIQAEGTKFVYVLDHSGSMGGDSGGKALEAAKAELLASLQRLDTVHQFQIIVYNHRPRVFNPTGQPGRLAFGTEQNKAEVRRFLGTVQADGGTDHEEAVMMALRMHPDVIFLLTDADDPKLSPRQLARIERFGAGITIHTVEFGTGPQHEADNFLVKIARQSGGEHAYVDVMKLPEAKPEK